MTKAEQAVWGRTFKLGVSFECASDDEVLDSQIQAKDAILKNWRVVDGAKAAVEKYCLKRDGELIGDEIENIFKYVIPAELLVLRDGSAHKVALMCNYRFDPEHGIAVVFKNERLLEVVPQDEL